MPRKSVKNQKTTDTTNQKRILIDSLELLRGNAQPSTKKGATMYNPAPALKNSANTVNLQKIQQLTQEVKMLKSANILLESDLKRMEQKALDAIAESGQLRRQLDLARDNSSTNQTHYYAEERQALIDELHHSRHTHNMLSEAITESQNEITRLTRSLEKLTLKLLVA